MPSFLSTSTSLRQETGRLSSLPSNTWNTWTQFTLTLPLSRLSTSRWTTNEKAQGKEMDVDEAGIGEQSLDGRRGIQLSVAVSNGRRSLTKNVSCAASPGNA